MPPNRQDTILPSLFDRLTGAGSFGGLYVTPKRYVENVQRDLFWLLKTDATQASNVVLSGSGRGASGRLEDENSPSLLGDFPEASKSVVAYGVPWSRGGPIYDADESELKRVLERAIGTFEPRLERLSIRVDASGEGEDPLGFSVLSVKISGHIRLKSERVDLLLQAYYTPAFAQWRIEGAPHGS